VLSDYYLVRDSSICIDGLRSYVVFDWIFLLAMISTNTLWIYICTKQKWKEKLLFSQFAISETHVFYFHTQKFMSLVSYQMFTVFGGL
jgi:hypothetical protein